MTAQQAIKFLSDLADECERSGQEFGKGRAIGIRESIAELLPHIATNSCDCLACRLSDELEAARTATDAAGALGTLPPS